MKNELPKISVITPNLNNSRFLERTILSVLNQNYPNLEYIIIDGGSNDSSLNIIDRYSKKLAYFSSEKDSGIYEALDKGFSRSTGDILCWINSDDIYWAESFSYVSKLFQENSKLNWLQGYPSVIDEFDNLLFERDPVSSKMFFFLKLYEYDNSFIQQESTFWRRSLWEMAGSKVDFGFSLAGDFNLWMNFYKFSALSCSRRRLGAFRIRKGQQSSNIKQYLKECSESLDYHFDDLSAREKILVKLYFTLPNLNFISQKIRTIIDKNWLFGSKYID